MGKILLVDDSKTSRKMLREIMEGAGHEIIGEAADGEEGYLKFKELKPDLVTLDITMPKMDGLEALKLIHKEDANAKVVMITAAGQKEKMMQAIKEGAAEFITKPYDAEEVAKLVDKVLAQ
ncbi:MAG: response regulator [Lachnospiraceae bacterium]|nr:response regulator [Lachnospiraceae bacterium]MCR5267608.1 response regulator [Lachnospiraceae bacterium]